MKKIVLIFLCLALCFGLAACAGQKTETSVTDGGAEKEQSYAETSTDDFESQTDDYQETEDNTEPDAVSTGTEPTVTEQDPSEISEQPAGERKVKLTVNGKEFDVSLYDTPAANALYDMLPLELNFEDYNGIEKIAFLENQLPTEGEPDEYDPDAGDLCLYAPWGNLTIFYNDFRVSSGLVSLGRIDSGIEVIAGLDEDFSATLSK